MFKEQQLPSQETQTAWKEEKAILCKQCNQTITSEHHKIEIGGKHLHTFFNPAGILFEIGCFSEAPGCTISGTLTQEFSWFPGFGWQYATCNLCKAHLGWYFRSTSETSFFGLIVNRLL